MPAITPSKQHFMALDGLRGVAAIAVAIYHGAGRFGAEDLLPKSYLAVDFFFLLSGVVVAYAYEDRLKAGKTLNYFLSRAIRLYPMIFIGAFLGALFYATHPDERMYVSLGLVAQLFALSTLSLPFLRNNVFPASHGIAPLNIPSWSLFFELFVNALYGTVAKHLTTTRIVALILVALPFECTGVYLFGGADFGFHISAFLWGFPRVVLPFFIGVFINRLVTPDNSGNGTISPSILGVALVLTFATPVTVHQRLMALEDLVAIVVAYPMIIVFAMRTHVRRWEKHIFMRLGELSFPIYLLHFPCLLWLDKTVRRCGMNPAGHPYFWISIEIIGSGALAIGVSHVYDIPLRTWLSKLQNSYTKGRVITR